MILQALYEFYQRKANDPESNIAPEGFQEQEIKFVIVINENGQFDDLNDMRDEKGKGKLYLLPKARNRSGKNAWMTAFLLWDHYGYVLCHPKEKDEESIKMAKNQYKTFIDQINNLPPSIKEDKGINAILRFYEQGKADEVKKHPRWQDCAKIPGCNLTFRLTGETQLIPEREVVVQFQKLLLSQPENTNENTENIGRCLITGEREFIARLHTPTFIQGGKSSARLVAFQKSSGYDSYGKEQGFNAPISVRAESAYTTALKHLLASKTNRQTISDATIIFWAEKRIDEKTFNLENNFAWYIADKTDDPDLGV